VARAFSLLALLALVVVGCTPGGDARKQMEGTEAPVWPALMAMNDDGGLMTVGMAMDMDGPNAAKEAAAAPQFKQLLEDLEKEPIPGKFSTPAREAAKTDFVESLRKLAEAGSDDEIKELWEKATASMATLGSP
jgi:hypothetical protein